MPVVWLRFSHETNVRPIHAFYFVPALSAEGLPVLCSSATYFALPATPLLLLQVIRTNNLCQSKCIGAKVAKWCLDEIVTIRGTLTSAEREQSTLMRFAYKENIIPKFDSRNLLC